MICPTFRIFHHTLMLLLTMLFSSMCSVLTKNFDHVADIWTLNLVCEGAAPGQENAQREMYTYSGYT